MRAFAVLSLLVLISGFALVAQPTPAAAQATCRSSCMSDESACLQRTGNKGQCGGKAQTCLAKCR